MLVMGEALRDSFVEGMAFRRSTRVPSAGGASTTAGSGVSLGDSTRTVRMDFPAPVDPSDRPLALLDGSMPSPEGEFVGATELRTAGSAPAIDAGTPVLGMAGVSATAGSASIEGEISTSCSTRAIATVRDTWWLRRALPPQPPTSTAMTETAIPSNPKTARGFLLLVFGIAGRSSRLWLTFIRYTPLRLPAEKP